MVKILYYDFSGRTDRLADFSGVAKTIAGESDGLDLIVLGGALRQKPFENPECEGDLRTLSDKEFFDAIDTPILDPILASVTRRSRELYESLSCLLTENLGNLLSKTLIVPNEHDNRNMEEVMPGAVFHAKTVPVKGVGVLGIGAQSTGIRLLDEQIGFIRYPVDETQPDLNQLSLEAYLKNNENAKVLVCDKRTEEINSFVEGGFSSEATKEGYTRVVITRESLTGEVKDLKKGRNIVINAGNHTEINHAYLIRMGERGFESVTMYDLTGGTQTTFTYEEIKEAEQSLDALGLRGATDPPSQSRKPQDNNSQESRESGYSDAVNFGGCDPKNVARGEPASPLEGASDETLADMLRLGLEEESSSQAPILNPHATMLYEQGEEWYDAHADYDGTTAYERAAWLFEKALEIQPDHFAAQAGLARARLSLLDPGRVLLYTGQLTDIISRLEGVLKVVKEEPMYDRFKQGVEKDLTQAREYLDGVTVTTSE